MRPGVAFANERRLDGSPQALTISIGAGQTSGSQNLATAVDWERSLIEIRGVTDTATVPQIQDRNVRITVSGTTVTATRSSSGFLTALQVPVTVKQYVVGTFKQPVQRGTVTMSSVATNTTTINQVDLSKAEVRFLGQTVDSDANQHEGWVFILNATTVQGVRGTIVNTTVVGFEVADWY